MASLTNLLIAALSLFLATESEAWRQWKYTSETSDAWRLTWGYAEGPRGRRGHSISMYKNKLIMFGGRDNEVQRQHVPKTYVSGGTEEMEAGGEGRRALGELS